MTVISTMAIVDGLWNITLTTVLPNGTYTLMAVATDVAGNPSGTSNSILFTVNSTPLIAPWMTDIADDVGVTTGILGNGSVTDDLFPTASGTGTSGSTTLIYDNGNLISLNTTAGADGKWSVDVPLSPNV